MSDVAGHKIVGADRFGAFEKFIVRRVVRDPNRNIRPNDPTASPDELQELMPLASGNPKSAFRQNFSILRKNRPRNVETRRFGYRDNERGALEAVWPKSCRNDHVCIQNESKRDHPRFFFLVLTARISRSICRMVILSVPLRFEFSPITLKISASGAASFI